MPSQILTYLVILCFERRYPKQNIVARLKIKHFAQPPTFLALPKFWAGYETVQSSMSLWMTENPPYFGWWSSCEVDKISEMVQGKRYGDKIRKTPLSNDALCRRMTEICDDQFQQLIIRLNSKACNSARRNDRFTKHSCWYYKCGVSLKNNSFLSRFGKPH